MSDTVTSRHPRRGLKAYVEGRSGFYVVNPWTNISNEMFATRDAAEHRIAEVMEKYRGLDDTPLVVVEL